MKYENDRSPLAVIALLVCALAAAPATAADGHGPGYVDGKAFKEIAGEDAVTVEINLSGALLQTIARANEDLYELIGGLESIHAIVLDLGGSGATERARKTILDIEKRLQKRAWERIALVREEDGEVRILVLADGEAIQGLAVMVIDMEEGEMVFANIAGELDLAAIQSIGESLEIPGLDDLDIDE
jgi:hypothetical protein